LAASAVLNTAILLLLSLLALAGAITTVCCLIKLPVNILKNDMEFLPDPNETLQKYEYAHYRYDNFSVKKMVREKPFTVPVHF
jgi:hypothetical protein